MVDFWTELKTPDGLPDYSVRISARARRAHLKVTPFGQIEVVIPRGFDPGRVPGFVLQHRDWLQRALARVAGVRGHQPELNDPLPQRVSLLALEERWRVRYQAAARRQARAAEELHRVSLLKVSAANGADSRAALRRWLTGKAKAHLVPWLQRLSDDLDLPVNKITVRGQKTRWGSCSSQKNISINRNLLFLPASLARYLFVHELCHTVYLNHSRSYWSLVGKIEPDYRRLDRELHSASRYVPLWAYPD